MSTFSASLSSVVSSITEEARDEVIGMFSDPDDPEIGKRTFPFVSGVVEFVLYDVISCVDRHHKRHMSDP